MELHATFLEINLVNQIRALPNPNYAPPNGPKPPPYPLTLHLSPTSTANIIVTSLVPDLSSNSPFAKLSPDAEVIIAPKARSKPSRSSGENRSVSSRKSAGGRSGASTVRRRSGRDEPRPVMFFRGLHRSICGEWFDDTKDAQDQGLKVWVDRDVLLSKALKVVDLGLRHCGEASKLAEANDPQ